jgi:hypothetical protein
MTGFIVTSLQLQSIMTAHSQWLSKTRSIPYWTVSVVSSVVTNDERRITPEWILLSVESESESHVTTDGQPTSLSWYKAPIWGLRPDIYYLCDSYGLVLVGRPLWREDGSDFYICCWPLPSQSFFGPSPLGLSTILYCLTFETSLFVASYDSQGHGGCCCWLSFITRGEPKRDYYLQQLVCCCVYSLPLECAYQTVAQQWTIQRLFVAAGTCLVNRC